MKTFEELKPIKRSKQRAFFGKKFHVYKRYFNWYLGTAIFSKDIKQEPLKHLITTHQSPLYRVLKDVDMWMQDNKVINLEIAMKTINGIVIKPGETFSYWKLIGRPNKAKGYVPGMVLHYGQCKSGIGGGLCQLSNLIFWMTLHSPLTVVERHRHGFDVFPDSNRTQPFGSGATCVYNYRDLQITNETEEAYQIKLHMTEDHLVGQITSEKENCFKYEIYEQDHEFLMSSWGSYIRHNEIHRKVFNTEGFMLYDEFICENNALMMYEPLLTFEVNKEQGV